jgi:hypothetical protein
MGFYPTIDYIGGMRGIADQLSAIPQDAMKYEQMRQQAEEAKSMQAYRTLQMQKLQDDMDQTRKLREAQAGFPAYLEQNKALLEPGVGQKIVPDYSTALDEYGIAGPAEKTETFATPPKKRVDDLAIDYYLKNSPEYGIKLMEHKRDMEEKIAQHKMTMASSLLGKAISEGDTEMFNQLVTQYKKDPHLAPMFGDVSNMKLNSKKELETESVREVKANEFTYPGTSDPVPPGKYDVKLVTKKDGTTVLKSIKPYEEKTVDRFEHVGHGLAWDKVEKKMVKVPVNPSGGLDAEMLELKKRALEQTIELKGETQRNKERDSIIKEKEKASDELLDPKNFEGNPKKVRGHKLRPEAEDAIKERLNKVGKDLVVDVEPGTKGGWMTSDTPDKFSYRIVDKKPSGGLGAQPISPPAPAAPPSVKPVPKKTSGLSGMSLNQLYALLESKQGLA